MNAQKETSFRGYEIEQGARLLLGIFIAMFLSGCQASYSPPMLAHTYTTNTQGYHALTTLAIEYKVNEYTTVAEVTEFTRGEIRYFIDGRKVGSHPTIENYHTMVQLPPGEHELRIETAGWGLGTLLIPMVQGQTRYGFGLFESQKGKVEIQMDSQEKFWGDVVVFFSDIANYQKLN